MVRLLDVAEPNSVKQRYASKLFNISGVAFISKAIFELQFLTSPFTKLKRENHILTSEDDKVTFIVPETSTPFIVPCQVFGRNNAPDIEEVFIYSHVSTFNFKLLIFPFPEKGKTSLPFKNLSVE